MSVARVRLTATISISARPLTFAIESGPCADHFDLILDSPEGCLERVRRGDVQLALLSGPGLRSLARASERDVRLVPEVAVVSRGPLPLGVTEATIYPSPTVPGSSADEWRRQSGLPLVVALWAGYHEAIDAQCVRWLSESRDFGLRHVPEIAAACAQQLGADPASYEELFTRSLGYAFGSRELSGLAAFLDHRRRGERSEVRTPIRFFAFAYEPERPQPVAWPRAEASRPEPSIDALLADTAAGARLSPEQAIRLYETAPLLDLGRAADQRRQHLHPDGVVTYIIDRNVNYTNLCVTACRFCNFFRAPKSKQGYTLSREVLAQKFEETVALGGVQILLQGGVNPDLKVSYFEDLFRWSKAHFPLALHALSPEEVSALARMEGLSVRQVLERLVAAGLDSLPGGGAEILDDQIRRSISPLKCSTDTWMEVMREAHSIGLRTTATMVFGFGENPGHLVRHLERLRALQDRTSGFTAFICWPFQAEGTRLRLTDDTTAYRYLRVFSLARLYLDNVPNLQVSWPTMGPAIGQVALRFGGNDFGSAMIEENVVSQAGAVFKLSAADIERRVQAAGFVPRRRNMRYECLPISDEPTRQRSRDGTADAGQHVVAA